MRFVATRLELRLEIIERVTELQTTQASGRKIGQLPGQGAQGAYASSYWHTLGAKLYPPRSVFDDDVPRLIREWIVPGYAPPVGTLAQDDSVMTIGSCFARHIEEKLTDFRLPTRRFAAPARGRQPAPD